MAAIWLHDTDVKRLAADVNAARAEGYKPTGGLLFHRGQFFQLLVTGESTVNYTIVYEQSDVTFSQRAALVAGLGAWALGTPLQVNGSFIQAFGDQVGGGTGSELPDGTTTGQALIWNGTAWVPGNTVLPELPAGNTAGYVLTWNGTAWIAAAVPTELPAGVTSGNVLTWNGTAWVSQAVPTELPAGTAANQTLQWNGSAWVAGQRLPAGTTSGHVLTWNGTQWAGAAVPTELPATATSGYVLTWNGSAWVAAAVPTELPATATSGYVLTWNGSAWVAAAVPTELPATSTTGYVLTWNGSAWVGQAAAGGGITPGTVTGQTTQWDGDSWEPGITPADADIWSEASTLGAPLPTVKAGSTTGYVAGVLVVDATGQAGGGALYVADGSTTLLACSGTSTSWSLTGVSGTGSFEGSASVLRFNGAGGTVIDIVSGSFQPANDNVVSLGASGKRWTQLWAATTTIATSDADYKTAPQAIPDAVLDAIGDVDLVQFKMLDAIAAKGEANARWHCGVIAQQVVSAFQARGLDATQYGIVCYDTWPAEDAVVDKDGNVIVPARPAGGMWSVRYSEILMLEAARVRRDLARLSSN